MNMKIIKEAIDYTIKEIKKIAGQNPHEKFPHERQIQCFLYDYFKNKKNFFVHPEAGYPKDNRKKCDLRIIQDRKEYWVEIKTASHGGKGLNNKPEEWQKDLKKLNMLSKKEKKIFILIGLFLLNKFPPKNGKFMKFIKKHNNSEKIDKLRPFVWKKCEIVPWIWIWGPSTKL